MNARAGGESSKRFGQIFRTRIFLSLVLLPPLLFFCFLVLWFREGFILIPVGLGLYLYMLSQFFIFQDPAHLARIAHRRPDPPDELPH